MKKFLAVFAVLAMAGISSVAFAADVTVGGLVQIRSRDFNNLSFNKDDNSKNQIDTQERIMIDVNAKADGVKGKISLWNDFNDWGGNSGGLERPLGVGFGNSTTDGNAFGFREAWINFNLPGIPVNVNAGHQFLALGNEWFLRSKHFGSDAWVVANVTGNNTAAIVDIKVTEGATKIVTIPTGTASSSAFANSDDVDAYAFLDVFKIDDNNMIGFNFAEVHDRIGALGGTSGALDNIELHYSGKLGPLALRAQVDQQMGKVKFAGAADKKFKGNEVVIQGNVALADLGVNFAVGRGSGTKPGSADIDKYVNFLDVDPHMAFIYEYKVGLGGAHLGWQNITGANIGASYAVSKSLTVGANYWFLQSTEKVANVKPGAAAGSTTNDVGSEFDINVAWKLYDNLSWNWDLGYLAPGAALGKDAAMGAMGVLGFKF